MASSETWHVDDPPRRNSKMFYKFLRLIGDGSFSNVYYCKDVETHHEVAIKVCDKQHIMKENKVEYIMREKEALNWCNSSRHPFVTTLYSTFQDDERLYFVLSFAPNGDLLNFLRQLGKFSLEQARFYSAEIVSALEFLHHDLPNGCHIVHRDIKPENVLLKADMHIMLCDFGSVKLFDQNMNSKDIKKQQTQPAGSGPSASATQGASRYSANLYRTKSFVGTAQYVSPEVLTGKPSSPSSDLWALGCVIFQLLTGKWPFCGETEYFIFNRITNLDYAFPPDLDDATARDLISKLLVLDPANRLGVVEMGGYSALRGHSFYSGIDWKSLAKLKPPSLRPVGTQQPQQTAITSISPPTSSADVGKSEDENIPPGFDDSHLQRLLFQFAVPTGGIVSTGSVNSSSCWGGPEQSGERRAASSIGSSSMTDAEHNLQISPTERAAKLAAQVRDNIYHRFVEGNLILKSGFLDKRVGLFSRRRMFLLTEGPRIFYVDPEKQVLKGEIAFSKDLHAEARDFKVFFVHTPDRTYYLIDREGYALNWTREINAVANWYFSGLSGAMPSLLQPIPTDIETGDDAGVTATTAAPPVLPAFSSLSIVAGFSKDKVESPTTDIPSSVAAASTNLNKNVENFS